MLAVCLDERTHERARHTQRVSGEGGDLADPEHGRSRRVARLLGTVTTRVAVQTAVRNGEGVVTVVVIEPGQRVHGGELLGPGPVDQRLEDGADADTLLDGSGFDP